jgi:phage gp36-like protein
LATTVYADRHDLTTLSVSEAAIKGISDSDVLTALGAASELADSYLGARFQLPLTEWGTDLRRTVCELAAYSLMKRRGFNPETADADTMKAGHDDSLKWLKDVAAGKAIPVNVKDSSSGAASSTTADALAVDAPMVVQNREQSDDYDEFWHSTSTSEGGVGAPRRRGW